MFGIGMPELMVILGIALVVIGPQKLPGLARSLGKGFAELKKAADDLQQNVQAETRALEEKDRQATAHTKCAEESAPEAGTGRQMQGQQA